MVAKKKVIKVGSYYRPSKKRKRKHKVRGYTRPARKKGRKLSIDPKPIIFKRYLVRDKSGHIITATEHPIQFKKKHSKRML